MNFTITKQFVLAGKAYFTVSNPGGKHYTYLVRGFNPQDRSPAAEPVMYFVYLLTGPDNTSNYTYYGRLDIETGVVRATNKSKWDNSKPPLPMQVLTWALSRVVWSGVTVPEGYGIDGEGRCGRCGRKLTHPDGVTPEGFRFGFGPECYKRAA